MYEPRHVLIDPLPYSHASKSMNELLHTLGPKSDLHKQRDISLLKTSTLQVQAFFLRYPPKNAGAFEDNLDLALNAIMTASGALPVTK